VNVNGNFLDICVLEWCKLFGDPCGKHYWGKIISDRMGFFQGLLNELKMSESEFNAYVTEMRAYRDKYVAHLGACRRNGIHSHFLVTWPHYGKNI